MRFKCLPVTLVFYTVCLNPWLDDGFEFGVDAGNEEEEEEDEVDQGELQRRKERLEREQWMREQVCVSLEDERNITWRNEPALLHNDLDHKQNLQKKNCFAFKKNNFKSDNILH